MQERKARRAPWRDRNFITEVLIPSLLAPRADRDHPGTALFPDLSPGQIGLTWIGHASFLIQTHEHNILVDPNWARWLMVIRRIRQAGLEIHELPNIDLVLITHAHFDHLNRRSLRLVAQRQPILVPEGVGSLVHRLGFESVHEMSWWEVWRRGDLSITFTPAKHWGARRLVDRRRGYGGFVIEHAGRTVYICGDSAWFSGFKEIGKRFRPEIAILPIGAYDNPSGRDHHISPEEAVRAFIDLKANTLVPMHFGTYRLSYEPMEEPPQRLMRAAAEAGCISHLHFMTEGLPQVF
ncbi:MAG: MBL fold metallo-hydrolase [Candidatus Methylacidiphilales bacterium]